MRSRWAAALLAVVVSMPAAAAPGGRTYRVAIDAEYAPYEFLDSRGRTTGIVPGLLRAIGASAHVEFQFLPMDWPDALAALDRGDVDLVNMLRTPERAERYEFSAPHGHVTQALFRNHRHRDIENLATIAGSRVALQRGDISLEKLAGREDFERVLVGSKEEGFMLLDSGLVAAFFVAEQPGLAYLSSHRLENVELVEVGLFPLDYCFAAHKGNVALISLLNKELAKLQQSGRFDDIVRPWLSTRPSWLMRNRREVLTGIALLLAVALANVLWNVQLRRTVRKRTAELREQHSRLQESEAHRRLLYEQCPIGLVLLRLDGTFVDVNQAFADIIGRTIDDILALGPRAITPPEHLAEDARQRRTLESQGRYGPYEKEYLHRDGRRVAVRLEGVLIEHQGERYAWSTVEDVTEERRQARQLVESNRRLELYRRVFESSLDAIAITDPSGAYVERNEMHRRLVGFSDAELEGQTPAIHMGEEKFREVLRRLASDGTFRGEIVSRASDGRTIEFDMSAFTLFDEHGDASFHVSIKRDVSQRRRSEQKIEQLAHILEVTSDFVAMCEPGGKVRYVNAAGRRMLGLPSEAALPELSFPDLYEETGHERVERDLFPRIARQGVLQLDCALRHVDGGAIPVSAVFVAHATSEDGRIDTISVIARDLSAEREMQARLEHGQRLESMGVLAGGIAHDFNNILTVILGNAAMAERAVSANPVDTRRYLANIVSSSERAAELCRQMLAYAGKGRFVVRAVDLSEVVGEVSRLLEVSIAKNAVLHYHLAANLPPVEVDVAQIQQVVMNLVINASDAIGERDGIISVGTGVTEADRAYLADTVIDDALEPGRYVYLEVADTGAGMDRKTRERVFEPFFTTKFAGHGLGMSAVLGIVRGHRGAIRVYSEVGRGSAFKVLLPANHAATRSAATAEDAVERGTEALSGTVLVVDDEASVREVAAAMLEDMGFTTLCAVDGIEAIRIFRERHTEISAVLLDMTMPKMDGKACYAELRRIDRDVRVVLSSGYSEEQAIARFPGNGFTAGFIQKPYTPEALREKMEQVLTRDE